MSTSITGSIGDILQGFEGISLAEVQQASLMQRRDNKYMYGLGQLPVLLNEVSWYYRVLEIEGSRTHNYQTLYYDTYELDMYHMHHRGMVNRHKIRFRKYGSTEAVYLEVKKKDARGVTVKNRMKTGNNEASILSREEEFLSVYTPSMKGRIIPVLENSFNRITLVNPDRSERITLDYHLWFMSRISEQSVEVPGVSICEIKYARHLAGSPFHDALRKSRISPHRFSKYCVGMALLDPELKQNLFKEKVRRVHKINNHYMHSLKSNRYA